MEISVIVWLFLMGISFALIVAGLFRQYLIGMIGAIVGFSVTAVFDTLVMLDGSAMALDWFTRLILGVTFMSLLMVTVVAPART